MENPSCVQLRSVICHVGSDSVTCHTTQENAPPPITIAKHASAGVTYSGQSKGWVDLSVGSIPIWFTWSPTVTHPSILTTW